MKDCIIYRVTTQRTCNIIAKGFRASIGFVIGSLLCFAFVGYLRSRGKKRQQQLLSDIYPRDSNNQDDAQLLLSPRIQSLAQMCDESDNGSEAIQMHDTGTLDTRDSIHQ